MKNNIRVNDIPLNERPIEKLLQFGVNTLSHDELLAIVLRTGTKGKCNRIKQKIALGTKWIRRTFRRKL